MLQQARVRHNFVQSSSRHKQSLGARASPRQQAQALSRPAPCSEACPLWEGLRPPSQLLLGRVPWAALRRLRRRGRKSSKVSPRGPSTRMVASPRSGTGRPEPATPGRGRRKPLETSSQLVRPITRAFGCSPPRRRIREPAAPLRQPGEAVRVLCISGGPRKPSHSRSRAVQLAGEIACRATSSLAPLKATCPLQDSGEPLMVPEDMVRALVPYNRLLGGRVGSPNPKYRYAARKEKSTPVSARARSEQGRAAR